MQTHFGQLSRDRYRWQKTYSGMSIFQFELMLGGGGVTCHVSFVSQNGNGHLHFWKSLLINPASTILDLGHCGTWQTAVMLSIQYIRQQMGKHVGKRLWNVYKMSAVIPWPSQYVMLDMRNYYWPMNTAVTFHHAYTPTGIATWINNNSFPQCHLRFSKSCSRNFRRQIEFPRNRSFFIE